MDFYEVKDADIVFSSAKSCLNIALNSSTFSYHLFGKIQLIYATKCVAFKEINSYVFVALWTGCRLSIVAKLVSL